VPEAAVPALYSTSTLRGNTRGYVYRRRSRLQASPRPVYATYGEQGPQIAGWFDRYEPRWAEGLHLLEAVVRSPLALATLLEAAGPGAEEQVGRIRARRQRG